MREIYTESVVQNTPGTGLIVLKYVFLALAILSVLASALFGLLATIVAIVFAVLFYVFWQKTDFEYEYIHSNQDFHVDKVIRSQKRKHLTTINLDHAVLLAPAGSAEVRRYAHAVLKDYAGTQGNVYALVCHANSAQTVYLLSLNDKMLQSLKKAIPTKVCLTEQ